MRIASLLPSATEIVCALGAADQLVAISHECDFPAAIRDRCVVTRSRIDPHGTSRSIDTAVRAAITEALSIYEVDQELLAAQAPDLIITQDLCEVCAVSLDDVRAAVARFAHRDDVQIVSLRPTRLADILGDLDRVAAVLGRPRVTAALEQRIRSIAARAEHSVKPRVVSLEWIDPLMIGGTWMPELVELAGGIAAGATAGAPAPTIDAQALAALDPEVIVVKPCGFTVERTLVERDLIAQVTAGTSARVYVTDGNAFFNRPGPRIVESLEIMAACVQPEVFADFARAHANVIVRLA